ncbi:MAG: hypothetical protein KME31_15125 [Tolypothrix carrinoi HA7290-LM1]|jgi:hypothetical protein|nr:hypothetical protein [Tolypothrix carrinoi HA7290-LM1]
MIISDISHIEVATEDNNIQGGYASAYASSNASAYGPNFAVTSTSTYTNANKGSYYYGGGGYGYGYGYNSATSGSGSSSTAA